MRAWNDQVINPVANVDLLATVRGMKTFDAVSVRISVKSFLPSDDAVIS